MWISSFKFIILIKYVLHNFRKYCTREEGFKLKAAIVKLCSETRHSIQPILVLREPNCIFEVIKYVTCH